TKKTTTTTTTVVTTVEEDAQPLSKTVHVTMIIDASGSMAFRIKDTLGGFKAYIDGLKADTETDYRVTVLTFNTSVRTLFSDVPLALLPELTEKNYSCGGNTALYDAIGTSINEVTGAVKSQGHPYGTDRVLMVILTDGEENSSHLFGRSAVAGKIKRREAAGNWTFVYVGSEASTWQDASNIGIARGSTFQYDPANIQGVFHNLSVSTTSYSASGTASTADFFAFADAPAATIVLDLADSEPDTEVDVDTDQDDVQP
ncbi:MAG: vWA domain-containing protein, partial [Ktedonobacterales bacterium]